MGDHVPDFLMRGLTPLKGDAEDDPEQE